MESPDPFYGSGESGERCCPRSVATIRLRFAGAGYNGRGSRQGVTIDVALGGRRARRVFAGPRGIRAGYADADQSHAEQKRQCGGDNP